MIAADTEEAARAQLETSRRARAQAAVQPRPGAADRRRRSTRSSRHRGPRPSTRCSPTPRSAPRRSIAAYLDDFARDTGADELVVVHHARRREPVALGGAARGSGGCEHHRGVRTLTARRVQGLSVWTVRQDPPWGSTKCDDLKTDAETAVPRSALRRRGTARGEGRRLRRDRHRHRGGSTTTRRTGTSTASSGTTARRGERSRVRFGHAAPLSLRVGSEVRTDRRQVGRGADPGCHDDEPDRAPRPGTQRS